jgi:hypothetical protein
LRNVIDLLSENCRLLLSRCRVLHELFLLRLLLVDFFEEVCLVRQQ